MLLRGKEDLKYYVQVINKWKATRVHLNARCKWIMCRRRENMLLEFLNISVPQDFEALNETRGSLMLDIVQ